MGNPSDIYGGVVLSCSTPARATCRLTLGVPTQLPDDPTLWNAAAARYPIENVNVEWSSDIPKSSGLAGSTALLAATLAAILTARGEKPKLVTKVDRSGFAELVRDVELNEAKVQCGFQDAYMAVYGGLQRMEFDRKSPAVVGPFATLESLDSELPFVLVTTGVKRLSGSVHGPVIERWLQKDPEIRTAVKEIIQLGAKGCASLLSYDLRSLAEAMTRNQAIIAAWGGSGEAIDQLVNDCVDCGAMSAKLAGAGLGGTVIALTTNPDIFEEKMKAMGHGQTMRPSIQPGLEVREWEE